MLENLLLKRIFNPNNKNIRVSSCNAAMTGHILSHHIQYAQKNAIFVTSSHADLKLYENILNFFDPTLHYVVFPPWDCLPYDRTGPALEITAQRIAAVKQIDFYLTHKIPFILLTTASALLQKIRKVDIIKKASVLAKPNKRVDINRLSKFLVTNGYLRTPTVREAGEFSVRGGIVDIFPSGAEQPVRLDFFGDVIERIKLFDPITQISTEDIAEIDLSPVSEILLMEKTINSFRANYRTLLGGYVPHDDTLYASISKGSYVQGMEAFLPLFDTDLTHLFEVLPDADIYFDPYFQAASQEFWGDIQDYYKNRKRNGIAVPPEDMYLLKETFEMLCKERNIRHVTPHTLPPADDIIDLGMRTAHNFVAARKDPKINLFDETMRILNKAVQDEKHVYLLCRSDGARTRLVQTLQDHGLQSYEKITSFIKPETQDFISFGVCDVAQGFENEKVLCLTEDDIFGSKSGRTRKKNKKADRLLIEAQGLSVGDYVVHVDNGIGRYKGLQALEVGGVLHDCVYLEYAGGDRLFVPVENIDLLTRYGSEGSDAVLDRLGSASWQGRKAKLKERITDIADALIKVAAERSLRQGEAITPIEDMYDDFRARFPYEETEDQMAAIEAVIDDMGSGKPMDRLICGDVGFGKTEVAMRAAFLAASAGIQTAIIVPTTLLVRQHYRNFIARFEDQPFKIGRLSRMVPAKEVAATREGMENGDIDIVIGTHALLSKRVSFKNLGLLIIDEEQHFGVKHKEKLKELKSNLHVLTLTATPIPRTLQLSMTGVRDLSLIATPPVDRLAIRTYVAPFEKDMVREALLREKYRGGQAFFVVPRLGDIDKVTQFLKDYIPEISFSVGHGQLTPTELESVMNDFYDRKSDVLVATTIIESGIDIPTANTMVVWRADMFGLAQLYQIRGRIGRSKLRAYAYLTTPENKIVTETAERRLKVLESLDSLGAGFTLASHDMDIRGAGNLLGSQQSGHIREVGFELYQQMLEEALANLKSGEKTVDLGQGNKSPQINIGLSAIIPENYIADLSVRLGLYRRLSELENHKDIDDFAAECIDRFGPLPKEVDNLLQIISLKNACKAAYVSKLDAGDKGILLTFHNDYFPEPLKLLEWAATKKNKVVMRPDHRVAISQKMISVRDRFQKSLSFLKEISQLTEG